MIHELTAELLLSPNNFIGYKNSWVQNMI